jgi:hypothetical protein
LKCEEPYKNSYSPSGFNELNFYLENKLNHKL